MTVERQDSHQVWYLHQPPELYPRGLGSSLAILPTFWDNFCLKLAFYIKLHRCRFFRISGR